MTEREKEWKELFFFLDSLDTSVILNRKCLAWKLLQAGYTKSHFPIEELEAWLREILDGYNRYDFGNIKLFNENPIQVVLDKIAELKEG
jgi:hypothetical protein